MAEQRDVDGLLRKLRSSRVCAELPDLIEALAAFDASRVLGPIVHAMPRLISRCYMDRAVRVLVSFGAQAVPYIKEGLDARCIEGFADEHYVKALRRIRSPRACETLVACLDHCDWPVRQEAARALGQFRYEPAVEALVETLRDTYSGPGEAAATALERIGDVRAVPGLCEALTGTFGSVAVNAARALASIGDVRAVGALIEAIAVTEPSYERLHQAFIQALGGFGPASLDELVDGLHHELLQVRVGSAQAVGMVLASTEQNERRRLRGRLEAPLVAARGETTDPVLRRKLAHALDALGVVASDTKARDETYLHLVERRDWEGLVEKGARAIPTLAKALSDPDDAVARQVARALGRVGGRAVIGPLSAVVEDTTRWVFVRASAATALGQTKHRAAVDCLNRTIEACLDELGPSHRDGTSFLRRSAVEALGGIGDERALSVLARVLVEDGARWNVIAAARAIGAIGSAEGASYLVEALEHRQFDVRKDVAQALDALGWKANTPADRVKHALAHGRYARAGRTTRKAVPYLIHRLETELEEQRHLIVGVLGRMGDTRAAPAVLAWLFEPALTLTNNREAEAQWTKRLTPLFGSYAGAIVVLASSLEMDTRHEGGAEYYDYGCTRGCQAVAALADDTSPVATALLHRVASKGSVNLIVMDYPEYTSSFADFTFDEQRSMALDELERRGNPPFDEDVFTHPSS